MIPISLSKNMQPCNLFQNLTYLSFIFVELLAYLIEDNDQK